MRASSILAASAPLLSLVQARIGGIGIPSTIKPGDTFNLVIEGEGYIQSVTDVSIAVGYNPGANPLDYGLGIFITAFDLVADSNYDGNYNKSVTLPATAQTGAATFTASLESLYGVQYEPALYPFNVSFTIGDATSTDYTFVGLNPPEFS
ncbi:hypothetical protein M406DRAFT_320533 [Cryphonectria parasitica EP155]|uniref:Uncharacterized protein n=1 Tax=Cryphonectria parasitica (strain ATCC 38755 / EP155) TaxID=660469 RepID=A0A9P4YCJ0_CRYP1|nr:uncharacterized protein M406DRAFT_320533 [Cryphonectria parasitica EP155]KAF3770851.1 hypothetical protein M406DRAFT_320533 [Cryphonectria parasitica EP155]